jgi:hypothetical protein
MGDHVQEGDMSLPYIRRTYNVPARRGARVQYGDSEHAVQGTIVGSRDARLRIRWDGSDLVLTYHPENEAIMYLKEKP